MKKYSIGISCSPYVGFKYGCHEDKDIHCVLGIKIIILKRIIWYDQDNGMEWSSCVELKIIILKRTIWDDQVKEMKMEFLCGTHCCHALAFVWSIGWSRSWEFDQEKNSSYGPKLASCWSHRLRHCWPRFRACNQMKNSLCFSRDWSSEEFKLWL